MTRASSWLLLANAILIALFLFLARSMWHQPEDVDNAITRAFFDVPIFAIAALIDVPWLIGSIVNAVRNPTAGRSTLPPVLAVAAWILAYAIDRSQWGPPAV